MGKISNRFLTDEVVCSFSVILYTKVFIIAIMMTFNWSEGKGDLFYKEVFCLRKIACSVRNVIYMIRK